MNTDDDDQLARRLKQLAGDPLPEQEAARRSTQFAVALERLHTDPREAARIAAIAREACRDDAPGTGLPTAEDEEFDIAAGLHDLMRRIDRRDAAEYHANHRSTPMADADPTSTPLPDDTTIADPTPEVGAHRAGPRPGESQVFLPQGYFTLTGREWAADILATVADAILHGAWPRDVTVFDLARAVRRAVGNADYLQEEQNSDLPPDALVPTSVRKAVNGAALEEFLQGWHAANTIGGPLSRDTPATELRSPKTGRMWWRTEFGEWTDGRTVCDNVDAELLDPSE